LSLLKKIKELNNFKDKGNFIKLICCEDHIGFVHKKVAKLLLESKLEYFLKNNNILLKEQKKKLLNITLNNTCELLYKKNIVSQITNEKFPCVSALGKKEYFVLERSLVEFLGIRGYGVHLTAYVKSNNDIKLWIPRRAKDKKIEPNKLDNTVAGGISAGETVKTALFREGEEEASFKKSILNKAINTGTISYAWRNKKLALRRDTLFLYDLEITNKTFPKNKDGELIEFKLYGWKKVLETIVKTNEFKKNSGLVLINFLIRRGLITPQNEKKYENICKWL